MIRVLAAVIGFSLGILATTLYDLSWEFAGLALMLAAGLGTLYLPRRAKSLLLAALLFLGVALGIGRTLWQPSTVPEPFASYVGSEQAIEGKVVADPDIREKNQRLTIEVYEGDSKARVLVVAPLYPSVRYGETIRAVGELSLPEPFETEGGRTFRYDEFIRKDTIFLLLQRASIEIIAPREGIYDYLRGALSDLKFGGIAALNIALPEPHSSLASGLILGGKQGLGTEMLDDFITTGLVHIVVLSGYNVMIVAEFIMRVAGTVAPGVASYAGAFSIIAFVLAAGAGPASIRAGIMAVIAVYARTTGKTYSAVWALMVAGVLMLLINPLTLPYDPGFQLSFVATLGLIFGAPITEQWLSWIRSAFLKDIVASTLAAQIAVLPLLLYQNGLFSVVALPANMLVLPVVPLAMLFSAIAGLAGALVPVVASAFAFPAYLLLSYIIEVVRITASVPLAAFFVPVFPFAIVIVAYTLLTLLVLRNASQLPTN